MVAYDDSNVFARILRGDLPCHRVHEDQATLCFMDVMPRVAGHVLVIPKHPCRTLLDCPPDVLSALMPVAQRVGRAAMTAFAAPGLTLQQFSEAAGGQMVFHLHLHLMPRHDGVPLGPPASAMAEPALLADQARRIREALVQ